jgi:hypothetical protein
LGRDTGFVNSVLSDKVDYIGRAVADDCLSAILGLPTPA